MSQVQIHGTRQVKPGTIDDTRVDSSIIIADGSHPFTDDQSLGGHLLTNLGTPLAATDATTKAYVDEEVADALAEAIAEAPGIPYQAGAGLILSGETFHVQAADSSLTVAADALRVADAGITETHLAASVAGNGLAGGAGTPLAVNVAAAGGLELAADALTVKLNGATLATGASGLQVAPAGITATELAASVAGDGLSGGAGTPLAVNVGATGAVEIASDALQVKVNGATLDRSSSGLKVADGGVTATQLAAAVAGDGLSGGAGSPLAVNVAAAGGLQVVTDALGIKLDGASLSLSASGLKLLEVLRSHLNTTTPGAAVLAKILAGTNITLSSTGVDAGTGDATIHVGLSATSRILGRITSGAGASEELTASQVLDLLSSTQGVILYRGASGWSALAPGTAGYVLTTNGAGADPAWSQAMVDLTPFHLVSAATTNATVVKASAGKVYGWFIQNNNASMRKLTFHNSASSPTAGASVYFTLKIPGGGAANVLGANPINFSNGIAITTTTDLADSGTTAVAANDLDINLFYV